MKHCTKCGRQYSDSSLNHCTEDGTPLSPQFDSEAEIVKIAPAMSSEDLMLEIANYLRRCGIEDGLVQFGPLAQGYGVTVAEVAEQFEAAAKQVDYAVIKRRKPALGSSGAANPDGSLRMLPFRSSGLIAIGIDV